MIEKGEVLYKELSYKIWGAALEVRKNFGGGHKEKLYQEAFADELSKRGITFEREKPIRIYHPKTGKAMRCSYQPDFIVDKKVIIELKAQPVLPKREVDQLYDYLRNSNYELGYLINFSELQMKPIRIIYTNDRKRTLTGTDKNTEKTPKAVQRHQWLSVLISVFLIFFSVFSVYAEDKQWSGNYDALTWENDSNWFSTGVPTASDDATVDTQSASVLISKTFNLKSLAVGGRNDSTITASNFVSGTIAPAHNTDNALYLRKGGIVNLQGAGTITLKGAFKNSEESLPDEPAFMFGAE